MKDVKSSTHVTLLCEMFPHTPLWRRQYKCRALVADIKTENEDLLVSPCDNIITYISAGVIL